jgi:predicted MFS family arabinose efflux permease
MTGYLRLLQQRGTALAFGFLAVFWGNFGQTFFVGVFSASIQESLSLSASVYGAVYSLATLGSALTVVWAGSLIDRVSLSRYTGGICLGLGCALLLMSQATGLLTLALGFFCLRLFGQALLPHTGMTTMARSFDDHRGKSLSIASSGVPVGEILMPLLGVMLIGLLGWQQTFMAIGLFMLIAALPAMQVLLRRAGLNTLTAEASSPAAAPGRARLLLLRDQRYWLALPGLMAPPFIVTGIFIHQDYVIATQGWTPAWFALCFVVYGVVHWLASLATGLAVDRFSAVRLLPFYLLPMAAGVLLLALASGQWVGIVMMTLLALTIGSIPPITGALWAKVYGVENLGTIRSLNVAIMVFATSLSPIVYGLCIDQGVSAGLLFAGSAAYVVLGALLIGRSYRPQRGTSKLPT